MKLDINVNIRFVDQDETDKKLNRILLLLQEIKGKEEIMSEQLDALTVQVTETTTLEQSAITLITGLADQIAAIKDDPAKVQALADQLKASAANLTAAIIRTIALNANTPPVP
jgi:hypothetical protein